MKTSARILLTITMLGTIGGACDRLVQAPRVELNGVRLRGIGLSGATLVAQLTINNPNRFALESDSISFEFEASDPRDPGNWTPVTSGTNRQQIRLARGSQATVEIPIDFAYSSLGFPARTLIERGVLNYRIGGEVFVRKPLRRPVPFSEEGSVSLSGS